MKDKSSINYDGNNFEFVQEGLASVLQNLSPEALFVIGLFTAICLFLICRGTSSSEQRIKGTTIGSKASLNQIGDQSFFGREKQTIEDTELKQGAKLNQRNKQFKNK